MIRSAGAAHRCSVRLRRTVLTAAAQHAEARDADNRLLHFTGDAEQFVHIRADLADQGMGRRRGLGDLADQQAGRGRGLRGFLRDRGGGRGLFTGCAAGDTGAAVVIEVA